MDNRTKKKIRKTLVSVAHRLNALTNEDAMDAEEKMVLKSIYLDLGFVMGLAGTTDEDGDDMYGREDCYY